jgi:hypothetical protein
MSYYPTTSLRRVRTLRDSLDRWVASDRRLAEEIVLGISPDDPGYDDLPDTLSELPSWPAWGNSVVDEATAFAKLGSMSGWSVGAIEDAILYALQENINRKVSCDRSNERLLAEATACAKIGVEDGWSLDAILCVIRENINREVSPDEWWLDEATKFAKLAREGGFSLDAIEDAIRKGKVSRDDPSNRWGLDEAAIAEIMAKACRAVGRELPAERIAAPKANPVTFAPIPEDFKPKSEKERIRDDWRFASDAFSISIRRVDELKFKEFAIHHALARIDQARRENPYLYDVQLEHFAQRAVVKFLNKFAPLPAEPVAAAPERPARAHVLDGLSLGHGVDWTQPGGLLGMMADWIMETSRRPNRPLAVASSVAVLSTLCGRHLYGPTMTALNLYIAALAETAVGKDRPFKAPYELLKAAGYGHLHQTLKVFSVSGVEGILIDAPCSLATVDELGTNLIAKTSGKKASTHEAAIKGTLQELWSRAMGNGPFKLHRRAKVSLPKNAEPLVGEVISPSLTLFGASTPGAFYEALSEGNIEDGFMNRFLIANAARRSPKSKVERAPVPDNIFECLQQIPPATEADPLSRAFGVFAAGVTPVEHHLEWAAPDVEARADAFEEEILAIIDAKPHGYALLGRVFEYTVRLASIHAISCTGPTATVGLADLHWGAAWAIESASSMMDAAATMMASNDYEKNLNKVRAAIRKAPGGVITRSDLMRAVRGISPRDMDGFVQRLKETGEIDIEDEPTAGRGAKRYRHK